MGTEEQLLSTLLEKDIFHNEDAKVSGIAKLAIDRGFDSLSPAQKAVLQPFMSHPCEGYTDPGGHHNECEKVLEGAELNEAYENTWDSDSIICENCREQSDYDDYRREKFMRD